MELAAEYSDMIVLCCYANLYPQTKAALNRYAPGAVFEYTGKHTEDYWNTIVHYWKCNDDLVIIEQDIEIGPDTISSFEKCPEPWCTFEYPDANGFMLDELGCVRFRREVLVTTDLYKLYHPNFVSAYPTGIIWQGVSGQVRAAVKDIGGFRGHGHGTVRHHHWT